MGDVGEAGSGDADYDAMMEEIQKRKEERRKQQEEEDRKEEEERKKREDERNARKLERERKAKEREDLNKREEEEKQKRDQRAEERKKKKEEREKQLEEERQKEREEEERVRRDKAERRKALEELDADTTKKEEPKEETPKRIQTETSELPLPTVVVREEPRHVRKPASERILEVVNNHPTVGHAGTIGKLLDDDDLRDELMRQLNEEHPALTEYFSTPDIIIIVVQHLITIPPNAEKLGTHQVDSIVSRMEFARDLLSGGMPQLWKRLLLPENYRILDELFALLRSDIPVLPLFHVNCFWKSLEFLMYRRGYDVSTYMHSRRADIVPSLFKHLRDSNVMDVMIKMVDNEAVTPVYKEYNPNDADIPSWCDEVVPNLLAFFKKDDTPTTDEEVENLSNFITQVFERYPSCKLAYQLREASFAGEVIKYVFSSPAIKHEATLTNLINFVTILFKPLANSAVYTTDLLPPLVSSFLSPLKEDGTEAAIDTLQKWLRDGSPFQKGAESAPTKRFAKNTSSFSVFRMKCLHCVNTLASLGYQCVDTWLQESGVLKVCIDLFFLHEDNNIVHFCVEDILKQILMREAQNDEAKNKITTYILSKCNLVERIVDALSTKKALGNAKGRFETTRIEPPPFSGHLLNICKLLSFIAEKSYESRTLIAQCSGYRWGQVVLFRLGMKTNADNDWKSPTKKSDGKENGPSA